MCVINVSNKRKTGKWRKICLFPAGFEPATLCVWGTRDNRYTMETCYVCRLLFGFHITGWLPKKWKKLSSHLGVEPRTFGLEVQRAIHCANGTLHTILVGWMVIFGVLGCTCFGSTYTKIGTIQRRLAWPLRKDDTQNREAFHIFWLHYLYLSIDAIWFDVYFSKFWEKWAQTWSFQVLSEASTHAGSNQVPIHICLVLNLSVDLIIVRYVLTLQWIIF